MSLGESFDMCLSCCNFKVCEDLNLLPLPKIKKCPYGQYNIFNYDGA